jgi:hypothetical protein
MRYDPVRVAQTLPSRTWMRYDPVKVAQTLPSRTWMRYDPVKVAQALPSRPWHCSWQKAAKKALFLSSKSADGAPNSHKFPIRMTPTRRHLSKVCRSCAMRKQVTPCKRLAIASSNLSLSSALRWAPISSRQRTLHSISCAQDATHCRNRASMKSKLIELC